MEYTKGEWKQDETVRSSIYANNKHIAEVVDDTTGEGEAIAQLISAAPQLLVALEEAVDNVLKAVEKRGGKGEPKEWVLKAQAAIKKAKGL